MSIGSIKNSIVSAVKAAPAQALKGTNTVGNFVAKGAQKIPFAKDKLDSFVGPLNKVGKNTAVGGFTIAAALALAVGCIKTIHSKVCEVKNNK